MRDSGDVGVVVSLVTHQAPACDHSAMTDWDALAQALNRTMAAHAPGWTDHNDHDPGVTLLEVMAYLAESLRSQAPGRLRRITRASLRKQDTLQPEASAMLSERWSGTKRPNYFSGRLLTVDDVRQEQTYHIEKHRRHLRTLHGFGTVSGLQVEIDASGEGIAIEPGLAIDAHGREIELNEEVTLTIPAGTSSPTLVFVEYVERYVDPMPAPGGTTEASRIEEGCRISLGADPCERGVAIARLVRGMPGWRVDPSFVPPRAV